MIERAYRTAEALDVELWCQDEAGPYQAIPQPGTSWQAVGQPTRRPHEYIRGGVAKLLTLFNPVTGEVRAMPVERTPNTVLHGWLKQELTEILATLPPAADTPARRAIDWAWDEMSRSWAQDLPPIRMVLVWDNLAGHHSREMVEWLLARGVWPLFTPLGGSWLNMAESIQRILIRRALEGQHPESATQVMEWLAATVKGWNADPTPFHWGGKRAARRERARARRHRQGGSGGYTSRPIRRRLGRASRPFAIGDVHDK